MRLNRRTFAKLLAAGPLAAPSGVGLGASARGRKIFLMKGLGEPVVFDLATGEISAVPDAKVGNWHSYAYSPEHQLAWLFGKIGKESLIVSLRSGAPTQVVESAPELVFYGHGCIDKEVMFCSESRPSGELGCISVRELRTGKLLDQWSSGGMRPHDCQIDAKTSTILVANSGPVVGEAPDGTNVARLDMKTGKIVERLAYKGGDQAPAHFVVTPSGEIVLGCIPKVERERTWGAILRSASSKEFEPLRLSTDFRLELVDEVLSLATSPDGILLVTYPVSGKVAAADLRRNEIVASSSMTRPRGVLWDAQVKAFLLEHEGVDGQACLTWLAYDSGKLAVVDQRMLPTLKSIAHVRLIDA